jgi:hypothetical protein
VDAPASAGAEPAGFRHQEDIMGDKGGKKDKDKAKKQDSVKHDQKDKKKADKQVKKV